MTPAALARTAIVLAAYLALAAVYTHPLLERRSEAIASDRYDPVLNASILWWNATTLPFSREWWTPPHYHPSRDIAAFTENLVGLGPVTTPVLRATRDPLLTYNLAVFLTWALSAFTGYLLARGLGAGPGPAFAGGLAFGFAPYRIGQMAHLQVLSCFWLPLAFLGLHRYLHDRRVRWLVLFGAAWILQSLTNGYFMLFGGVVIGLWLAYFCSTAPTWRLLVPIGLAWTVATLPLLPVLLKYREVHAYYGLARPLGAIIHYSAEPASWLRVSNLAQFWRGTLKDAGEANLFPGATVLLIVIAGCLWTVVARRRSATIATPAASQATRYRAVQIICGGLVAISCIAIVATLIQGPWRIALAGVQIRMSSVGRAAIVALLSGAVLLWLRGTRLRLSGPRSPFRFYVLATVAVVILCMGPQIRMDGRVLIDQAPYRWLMILPGFDGLRVPTRFWMIGALCLAMAAALALERMLPAAARWRVPLLLLLSSGILADGWMREMPLARAPELWPRVERRDTDRAILELPLGPEFDAAATFRAVAHRRRVVNGVSGYDPPHYALLQRGLNAHDPSVLLALASLAPLDVVVDAAADPNGELDRYVAAIPGVDRVASDGTRVAYRMPDPVAEIPLAPARLPIVSMRASRGSADPRLANDDNIETTWGLSPQIAGDEVTADLGSPSLVAGVTHTLGVALNDYPRQLAIDLSLDGTTWELAWEGPGLGHALTAVMREPRDVPMVVRFAPRPARFVRLRLGADAEAFWTIAELRIHAPEASAQRPSR